MGATSSYDLSGWGATGGVETTLGSLGSVGLSLGYLAGKDGKGIGDNELLPQAASTKAAPIGAALWVRSGPSPGQPYGTLDFEGSRFFTAEVDGSTPLASG